MSPRSTGSMADEAEDISTLSTWPEERHFYIASTDLKRSRIPGISPSHVSSTERRAARIDSDDWLMELRKKKEQAYTEGENSVRRTSSRGRD